jgi:hypothetical protein
MNMRLKLTPLLTLGVLGLLAFSAAPASATLGYGFTSSFGKEGSGTGEFNGPRGVAVNEATGDVYVVDTGNNRVEYFSSTGAYVGEFNGRHVSAEGTGTLKAGEATITVVHATSGAFGTGEEISAPGLPAGTTITGVPSPGVLEVSNPVEAGKSASGVALTAYQSFSSPISIAIDNSTSPTDPSKGDVYVDDFEHEVLDKFSATGTYLGQITEAEGGSRIRPRGVAVDSGGEVWVSHLSGEIDNYSDALVNELIAARNSSLTFEVGLAVDSGDHLYSPTEKAGFPVGKISSAGVTESEDFGKETLVSGVAVSLASNDVFLDANRSVAEFDPAGSLLERFGNGGSNGGHILSGGESSGSAVAVDAANGTVYVADSTKDAVEIFTHGVGEAPAIANEHTTELNTAGGATLNAGVDPEAQETTYHFEYSTEANGEELLGTIEKTPAAQIPAGSTEQPVSAALNGLLAPLTTYYYRVVAENAVSGAGEPADGVVQSFTTRGISPVVSTGAASEVLQASADVTGTIGPVGVVQPGGAETYYYYQYGPTTEYGQSTASAGAGVDVGSGTSPVGAPATLVPLTPGVTYHYRLVAWNEEGTSYGQDQTFTTPAGLSPTASTGPASGISGSEATISGTIDPEGKETSYRFEYGANTEYGTEAFGTVLPELGVQTVTLSLRGLDPGTTYHYRIVVSNPGGSSIGADQSFTTPGILDPLVNPAVAPQIANPAIAFPKEEKGSGTTTKTLTNKEKLAKALRACARDKNKTKRAACRKQAQKKYPPAKKKKAK